MSSIIPVSTSRVSSLLVTQSLLSQIQSNESDLLKIQNQISTGQRISLGSEDAPAALRAIGLQNLLDRKSQFKTNLQTNQAYLGATDTALANASSLLASARGVAVSAADGTSDATQRGAAADQIGNALQQLVSIGNQQFNGRYLFAGSKPGQPPFELVGNYVRYNGNDQQLPSIADLNNLFSTNVTGNQAFGAISTPLQGSVDLNPILTRDTKLSTLNGGAGIAKGSITVTDGVNPSVVDLSHADTLGDVIDAIERNPPAGRSVKVDLTAGGLNVSIDSAGGGNLAVLEVGSGSAARDLGIARKTNSGVTPIVGSDINPQLSLATPLSGILGSRSSAKITSAGANNDLLVVAKKNGAAYDGLQINFVDDGTVTAGNEQVTYDSNAHSVTVKIQTGATSANQIRTALNGTATFAADYETQIDAHETSNSGNGAVAIGPTVTTSGGSGSDFDQARGLTIVNGDQTYQIDLSNAKTIEDVLNTINGAGASVLAEINSTGNGLNIRSRLSGADFSIGENGGQTASQLGLRTFSATTNLDDLNHGLGVHASGGPDFAIQRKDNSQLQINLSSAKTIGDVLNLINNDPNNQNLSNRVTASLNASGNGISLSASSGGGTNPLVVTKIGGSQAAEDLGLIPVGANASAAATIGGGVDSINGRDANPQEVAGLFTSLLRAKTAVLSNDLPQIHRSLSTLDTATNSFNAVQAELGARQQNVDALQTQLTNDTTSLTDQKSQAIDTDIAASITDLLSRQSALQAALKLTAQISQLSILNYL